jgi:hypothetical protein
VLTDEDKRRLREARFGVAATTGADVQLPPRKENAPPATGKGSEKGKAAAAKPKPEPRKPLTPEERAAKDAETKAAREKRDAERKAEREQREAERAAEVASVRARAERFGTEMPKIVQEWDAQQERKAERERKAGTYYARYLLARTCVSAHRFIVGSLFFTPALPLSTTSPLSMSFSLLLAEAAAVAAEHEAKKQARLARFATGAAPAAAAAEEPAVASE